MLCDQEKYYDVFYFWNRSTLGNWKFKYFSMVHSPMNANPKWSYPKPFFFLPSGLPFISKEISLLRKIWASRNLIHLNMLKSSDQYIGENHPKNLRWNWEMNTTLWKTSQIIHCTSLTLVEHVFRSFQSSFKKKNKKYKSKRKKKKKRKLWSVCVFNSWRSRTVTRSDEYGLRAKFI